MRMTKRKRTRKNVATKRRQNTDDTHNTFDKLVFDMSTYLQKRQREERAREREKERESEREASQ